METVPHSTLIQTRFNDADGLGHLNNTTYALYCETARMIFFKDLGFELHEFILANINLDFKAQALHTQEILVHTEVSKLGNTSIALKQEITAEGVVAMSSTSVVVHFDYAINRPKSLSPQLREQLERYILS